MRIGLFIILSLLLQASLAINACSIRWDEPGSQSIDQMFSGDNRSIDMGSGITRTVNTGSFSSGSSDTESPKAVRTGQEPVGVNSDVQTQLQSSSSTTISGKWFMEFNFGSPPKASLNLFQNGDVVYGTGAIVLDAKSNLEVAAGGTVMGDKMNLDIISLGNVSLYRVSMTVSGNSASGSYTAYSPNTSPISGTATGIRSATQSKA
jgi:hypothetical protein